MVISRDLESDDRETLRFKRLPRTMSCPSLTQLRESGVSPLKRKLSRSELKQLCEFSKSLDRKSSSSGLAASAASTIARNDEGTEKQSPGTRRVEYPEACHAENRPSVYAATTREERRAAISEFFERTRRDFSGDQTRRSDDGIESSSHNEDNLVSGAASYGEFCRNNPQSSRAARRAKITEFYASVSPTSSTNNTERQCDNNNSSTINIPSTRTTSYGEFVLGNPLSSRAERRDKISEFYASRL